MQPLRFALPAGVYRVYWVDVLPASGTMNRLILGDNLEIMKTLACPFKSNIATAL